jgi:hypothetical protein
MYKKLKDIIARPTGNVALDKFQQDVVAAFKSFLLTVFDANNDGLVPAPPKHTTPHTLVLWDDGWHTP